MKRVLLAAGFALLVLLVGGSSGLAPVWLFGGAVLAGGFGWMLGGAPSGPSAPDNYTDSGSDGGSA